MFHHSPLVVGSHNPPSFVAQSPCWHSFPSIINVSSHDPPPFWAQRPRWSLFTHCGISQFTSFVTQLALIPLSNRCGFSRSTFFLGPAFSLVLIPLFNQCGISQSTPIRDPASLLAHRPVFELIKNISLSSPTNVGSHNDRKNSEPT